MDVDLTTEPELTRADGLWFEDCGLIIQAETTIFRVSSAILATHSPVFRDMISLPTSDDADTMDGSPLVILPDSAKDVDSFLRALFYYEYFEPFPGKTTFPILSGVLRLSHKYEIDALRKRALIHLSSAYPTMLEEWDLLSSTSPLWLGNSNTDDNVPIIKLARQLGAEWILPTAFYRICQTSFESTVVEKLSSSEVVNYIKGCRYLVTTGAADVLNFFWDPPENCECAENRRECQRKVERRRDYEPEEFNTMPLELWRDTDWDSLAVCEECMEEMKDAHAEARGKLWNCLPKIFGLPEWPELEKMKAEALE